MTKETLHPEDIKYIIKKHGVSLSDLARTTGLAPSTIRNALRYPLFAGEQAIAQFLNVHPMILWPSRYDSNGKPLHPHASASHLIPFSPVCKEKENGGLND